MDKPGSLLYQMQRGKSETFSMLLKCLMKRPASGARRKSVTKTSLKKKGGKIDKNTLKQVDKVEVVKVLVAKYGLSNIDALVAYDKFFKKYPTGVIKKAEFMEEYKVRIMFEISFLMTYLHLLSIFTILYLTSLIVMNSLTVSST